MIHQLLRIWSLVPLTLLNAACTSGSSQFTYCRSQLEDFENYLASMWNECSFTVVWTFFDVVSLGLEWKLTFSIPVVTAEFSVCWHIDCSTLTASSFRIFNNSAGFPSPMLALFLLMLPKSQLASHSMSGSHCVTISWWLSRSYNRSCQ